MSSRVREVEASKGHKLKKVEDVPGAKSGTISNQSKVGRRVPRSPIIQRGRDGQNGQKATRQKPTGRNQGRNPKPRQKPRQKPTGRNQKCRPGSQGS